MFSFLDGIARAWREIAHVSELTGLSAGILIGLAALAYLDPVVRAIAIRGAVVVAIAYGAAIVGIHVGATDVRAEWNAANAQVAKESKDRDDLAAKAAEATYGPIIAAREQEIADLNQKVSDYATKHSGNSPCALGADALRVRHR